MDKSVFSLKDIKENKRVKKVKAHETYEKPGERTALNYKISQGTPFDAMLKSFIGELREELLGFLDMKHPKYRVVTSGGYGLKTLVEHKYDLYGRVKTSDVDITVGARNIEGVFALWSKRVNAFISKQNRPEDFKVKVVNFGGESVPLLNYKRYYVIMISYKDADFVDIAITDMKITRDMLDVRVSKTSGLPVKKEEYYLQEFLTLIYMENVPGVNDYCYGKRNPVTGTDSLKGRKDIYRSKLLCKLKHHKRYLSYCRLLRNITIQKLKNMSTKERDEYFTYLKYIMKK